MDIAKEVGRGGLDAVTVEILWTRLVAVVDEAAATYLRTSFSTLVRESNDFAVVLTDAEGRSLAQSSMSIPSFIATLPATVRHFLARFPARTLAPGDVLITNDPWMGTGHLNDVSVAMPIFQGRRLVAFAAVTSHMPDIGGRLRDPNSREIFEEGLQIPRLKLMEAWRANEAIVRFIERNVRVPAQTMGDIWGEVAACRMLERRLLELLAETAVDLGALAAEIQGRAEAAMRRRIRAIPDGDYRFRCENDVFGAPLVVACRARVRAESVHIDFSGSSPQQPSAVNVVPIYAYAYSAFALKCMLAPDTPNNDGSFRALTTRAPPGSVLNPRYPAACLARSVVGHLIAPAVIGALAKAVPERAQAAPGSPNSSFSLSGAHGDRRYTVIYFLNGGQGASAHADGLPAISFPSNTANTPIEVMEALAPIRIERRALRDRSGGEGARRGGSGQVLDFTFTGEADALCSIRINRSGSPAPGLAGGRPGRCGRLRLNGRRVRSVQAFVLGPGDRVSMETAAGGGFGRPRDRLRARRARALGG